MEVMPTGTCAFWRCENRAIHRGFYCAKHYKYMQRHEKLIPYNARYGAKPLKPEIRCSVGGCHKVAVWLGLCRAHYAKQYRQRPGVNEKLRAYDRRRKHGEQQRPLSPAAPEQGPESLPRAA